MNKKIIYLIVSVIGVVALSFAGLWVSENKNALTSLIDGSYVYTAEDLQNSYDDGYADGVGAIEVYENQIINLSNQIDSLLVEKTELLLEISSLELLNLDYENQISLLNSQISVLSAEILDLQSSLNLLQEIIDSYLSENEYLVTFMFEDSVYDVQVVSLDGYANFVAPESSEYLEFIGWSIDGENTTDVSIYRITEDTTFTALLNTSYDVSYTVSGLVYYSEIVSLNNFSSMPTVPVLENYEFIGWSIDGESLIDVSSYAITNNTTFVALFDSAFNFEMNFVDYNSYWTDYDYNDLFITFNYDYDSSYFQDFFANSNSSYILSFNFESSLGYSFSHIDESENDYFRIQLGEEAMSVEATYTITLLLDFGEFTLSDSIVFDGGIVQGGENYPYESIDISCFLG